MLKTLAARRRRQECRTVWVRGLGWERIPRGLRRRSNRGDSFSPPSVLAAEMMSACGELPWKTPKNQFPAPHSDRPTGIGSVTAHRGSMATRPQVRARGPDCAPFGIYCFSCAFAFLCLLCLCLCLFVSLSCPHCFALVCPRSQAGAAAGVGQPVACGYWLLLRRAWA